MVDGAAPAVRGGARADVRRNRAAILAAAEPLVTAAQPATMADVARAAGVTRATLYRHFRDREALVDALLLDAVAAALPQVLGALEEPDLGRALDGLAHAVLATSRAHLPLLRSSGLRLEELARAVPDEPMTRRLAHWRAAGQLSSPSADAWLATAARALCLAAVAEQRPAQEVAADLATSLRRLTGVPD